MARGIADLVRLGEITASSIPPVAVRAKGQRPIKRLTVQHRRMIALHLQGCTPDEISEDSGRRVSTVKAVLRNPTSQVLIQRAYEESDDSLKNLVPLSHFAIRSGLMDNDNRVKLQAVDRLYRALGKYRDSPEGETSAEDVVRRIIRIRHGDMEIAVGEEKR